MHLLENNVPLTLSVYSVIFKINAYEAYHLAMMQIWVMFFIYKRCHYDKSPLVWLAQRIYWNHPMYKAVTSHLEEEVEHFHGQLRGETNEWDSAEAIRRKSLWLNQSKGQLHNFYTWFLPPPRANYSHRQLRRLKVSAAMFILNTIEQICTHPFAGQEQPRMPQQRRSESRWVLPALLLSCMGKQLSKTHFCRLGTSLSATKSCITPLELISASSLRNLRRAIWQVVQPQTGVERYCSVADTRSTTTA